MFNLSLLSVIYFETEEICNLDPYQKWIFSAAKCITFSYLDHAGKDIITK